MEYTHRNEMAKHTTDDYYEIVKDIKNWVHRASAHLNYVLAKQRTMPDGKEKDSLVYAINNTHFHDDRHADEYRDGGRFAYTRFKTYEVTLDMESAVVYIQAESAEHAEQIVGETYYEIDQTLDKPKWWIADGETKEQS
jgi:hypothetical protein